MRLDPVPIGMLLILTGLLLVFLGSSHNGDVEAGGVVFIGPVPIPFGPDRLWMPVSVIGAVVLTLFYFARP